MEINLSSLKYLNIEKNLSKVGEKTKSGKWVVKLIVSGIHCISCISTIERRIQSLDGIKKINLHLATNQATVEWDNKIIKFTDWVKEIETLGFQLHLPENLDELSRLEYEQKKLLWNWFVALICTIQIMMFSMPSYVATGLSLDPTLKKLFDISSFIVIIPVLIFPGKIFFLNTINAIKRSSINMDVPITLGITLMFIFSIFGMLDESNFFRNKVYFDSISMLIFFLTTSRYLEIKIKNKTWQSFNSIFKKLPNYARKICTNKDGDIEETLLDASQINISDVIKILPGEEIPMDGKIIEGQTHINHAFISGESFPIMKFVNDYVMAGSLNIDGVIYVKVSNAYNQSSIYQIKNLIYEAQQTKPIIIKIADKIAKPFLYTIIILSLGSYFLWIGHDSHVATNAMISVLIVTCPCALYLSSPLAMIGASNALAKHGIYVKNLNGLEVLNNVDYVVFDKTGTLTNEKPTISKIYLNEAFNRNDIELLLNEISSSSLHPYSKEITNKTKKSKEKLLSNFREIFGQGVEAVSKKFGLLRLGSESFCNSGKLLIRKLNDSGQVHLVTDREWLASIHFNDNTKPYAKKIIKFFKDLNIDIAIYSGDIKSNVMKMARKLNIENFYSQQKPDKKFKNIKDLQKKGHIVLMVGDGLNDGPALAQANTSIAMGMASSIIQSKSDFIVLNSNLSSIQYIFSLSKKLSLIVRQNMTWAILYNLIMIPFAFMGLIEPWFAGLGMSLSSLIVVLNSYRINY